MIAQSTISARIACGSVGLRSVLVVDLGVRLDFSVGAFEVGIPAGRGVPFSEDVDCLSVASSPAKRGADAKLRLDTYTRFEPIGASGMSSSSSVSDVSSVCTCAVVGASFVTYTRLTTVLFAVLLLLLLIFFAFDTARLVRSAVGGCGCGRNFAFL